MSGSNATLETAVLGFAGTAAFLLPGGPLISAGISFLGAMLMQSTGPTGPSLGTVIAGIVAQQSEQTEIQTASAVFQNAASLLTNYTSKAASNGLQIPIPSNINQQLTQYPTGDFAIFLQPILNAVTEENGPLRLNIALLGANAGTYPNLQSQSFALWAYGVGVYLNLAKALFLVRSYSGKQPDAVYAGVLAGEVDAFVAQANQVAAAIVTASASRQAQVAGPLSGIVNTANPFADAACYYITDSGPNPAPIVDNCSGDDICVVGQGLPAPVVSRSILVYTNGWNPTNQTSSLNDATSFAATYKSQLASTYPTQDVLNTVTQAAQNWATFSANLKKLA